MIKTVKVNYKLDEPYENGTYIDPITFFKCYKHKKDINTVPVWAPIDSPFIDEDKCMAEVTNLYVDNNKVYADIFMYDKRKILLDAINKDYMMITPLFETIGNRFYMNGFYMSFK